MLLNLKRCDELSKDMSWKPGTPQIRDESKWLLLVQPKVRSVSLLSRALQEVCKNTNHFPELEGSEPKTKPEVNAAANEEQVVFNVENMSSDDE